MISLCFSSAIRFRRVSLRSSRSTARPPCTAEDFKPLQRLHGLPRRRLPASNSAARESNAGKSSMRTCGMASASRSRQGVLHRPIQRDRQRSQRRRSSSSSVTASPVLSRDLLSQHGVAVEFVQRVKWILHGQVPEAQAQLDQKHDRPAAAKPHRRGAAGATEVICKQWSRQPITSACFKESNKPRCVPDELELLALPIGQPRGESRNARPAASGQAS